MDSTPQSPIALNTLQAHPIKLAFEDLDDVKNVDDVRDVDDVRPLDDATEGGLAVLTYSTNLFLV